MQQIKMTVTEITKEIYDKYPKMWGMLKNRLIHYEYKELFFKTHKHFIMIGIYSSLSYIPFSMLYGILEDFFEDNGIHIWIIPDLQGAYIMNVLEENWNRKKSKIKTKTEAKMQAILKACEILEDKL